MKDVKIVAEFEVTKCYEVSIDFDGSNYLIIFGKHVNGGFFSIVNHKVCGELATFTDIFWNAESIGNVLNNFETGKVIAEVIAEFD